MPMVPSPLTPPAVRAARPSDGPGGTVSPPGAWWTAALAAAETAPAGAAAPPPWAMFVTEALDHAPDTPHGPSEPVRSVQGMGPEGRLVHPLWPFLLAADVRFALACSGAGRAAEDRAVWAGARRHLAAGLVTLAARTLVAELRAARAGCPLPGRDGRQRFDHVVHTLAARPALTGLLCLRHPVLARLLAERCLNTVDAAVELRDRLRADREALARALLDGAPVRVERVRFGLGDPHAAGRTVALLEVGGGRRLVYKPRPLGLHARWNDLLAWLAGHHGKDAPRAVRLLAREGYGWAEYVAARPCGSAARVAAFYRRMGAQLALLHAVDAVDVHAENVIAAGDQPVVVDVETLFHPCWVPDSDGGADPAAHAIAASVQRTAVLPNPLFGENGVLDVSALGALRGSASPHDLPAWERPGTDRMRLVRRPGTWQGGANRPLLGGTPADPADHVEDLLDGFRTAYRTIAAHAAELYGDGGPLDRFAGETARLVVRPSQTYAELLAESTEPRLLRTMSDREEAFAPLLDETGHRALRVLAAHERADLMAGEIPVFTTTPGSRSVRTSRGLAVPALLAEPGLTAVRARLPRMGEADLRRQEWLIRASLATKRGSAEHGGGAALPPRPGDAASAGAPPGRGPDVPAPRRLDLPPGRRPPAAGTIAHAGPATAAPRPGSAAGRGVAGGTGAGGRGPTVATERLLATATAVGDDLVGRCCRAKGRANWLGLQLLDERCWSVLPMGAGLGDGYTGTALFLAELGRLTGVDRYRELAAEAVVGPLPRMLRLLAAHPALAAAVGPGGFRGLGGITYATARLATLLDSAELAAVLPDALSALGAAADAATVTDVADGITGGLLAARAVHAEAGLPQAARLARALATRVAAAPRPYAPGFLWGGDGVAWALGERPGPDARVPDGLGWCTGLAGTALGSRAADRYLAAVADRPPLPDHSLCHGELGVLEPLVELPAAGDVLHRACDRLLRSAERHGPCCGTPCGVPTPGLLTGLAGIGYGLLRLAFGHQIPSVLLLRPAARPSPVEREEGPHPHGQPLDGQRTATR